MNENNPYSTPHASLEAEAPVQQYRLGGRGERLGAAIVDGIIQIPFALPLMYAFGYFDGIMKGIRPSYAMQALSVAIGFVLFVAIQGYPLAATGQTWGKKLLKLKIVDLQGATPDFVKLILLRYATTQVSPLVPVLGTIYVLVDTLFIFREDKRCIHDHIAGTRVVVAE